MGAACVGMRNFQYIYVIWSLSEYSQVHLSQPSTKVYLRIIGVVLIVKPGGRAGLGEGVAKATEPGKSKRFTRKRKTV